MPVRHARRHHPHAPRRRLTALTAAAALAVACLAAAPTSARAATVAGPLMYVSELGDFAGSEFQVVDTATDQVTDSLDEVARQGPEAMNPAGTQVYVSFGYAVEVFDTASNTFGASIAEPPTISDIAINPSGTQTYVTSSGSSDVSVIDTASQTAVATIPVASAGGNIAFSPSGALAYVTAPAANSVSVIDTASQAVVDTIPVGNDPTGLAVDPSGTVAYATDSGDNTVSVISTATDTVTGTIPVGADPLNIALTPDGTQAIVTNEGDSTVSVLNIGTDTVTTTIPLHAGGTPTNIAFNEAGTLAYVTEPNLGWIDVIDTGTDQLTRAFGAATYAYDLVLAPTAQPTTTTLTASPGGTVTQGTPATLTATVTPSTPGTVQFLDNGNAVGSPVTVNVNSASYTTGALGPGSHSLTAVFTPSASTSTGSSSAAVPLQVTPTALAIDQVVTQTGNGTVTTAPFTTTGPRLLVAFTSSDGPATRQTTTITGAGLTWALAERANTKGGTAEIWTAQAAGSLSGATVTSTPKTAGYDQSLTLVALSNAAGIGAGATAGKSTGAPTVSLTTTKYGSWVFGVGEDYSRAIARTLGSGQNPVSQWVDTKPGETFWVQDETAAQPGGTLVTINDTAPTTDIWNLAAVEIVPSNG
jgi:YVTN family beta-propeller protein